MNRLTLVLMVSMLSGLGCTPFLAKREVATPPQVEMQPQKSKPKTMVTADETNSQNAKEKASLLEREINEEMRPSTNP